MAQELIHDVTYHRLDTISLSYVFNSQFSLWRLILTFYIWTRIKDGLVDFATYESCLFTSCE